MSRDFFLGMVGLGRFYMSNRIKKGSKSYLFFLGKVILIFFFFYIKESDFLRGVSLNVIFWRKIFFFFKGFINMIK